MLFYYSMPNKPCYLKQDIYELASKMDNFSSVVNELLAGYFKSLVPKTKEQLEEKLRVLKIQKEALDKITNGTAI